MNGMTTPSLSDDKEMMERKGQRAICVLGMHRSGTSVVARAINLLGAYLGKEQDLLPPAFDNPEGVWERRDIVDLHDRIFSHFSRSWHTSLPLPDQWHVSEEIKPFRNELIQLISQNFAAHSLWAWKDPRTSVFLPLWKDVLNELKIDLSCVYVVRNPLDVAKSLYKREGFSYDKSFRLWFYYNFEALQASLSMPCFFITFKKFLQNWELELRRCVASLKINWPKEESVLKEEMRKFIYPGLCHSASGMKDLETSGALRPAIKLYRLLEKAAEMSLLPDPSFTTEETLSKQFSRFFQSGSVQLWKQEQQLAIKNEQVDQLQTVVQTQQQTIQTQYQTIQTQRQLIQDQQQALNSIYLSLGWKLSRKFELIKDSVFPIHTRRRKYYDLVFKYFKVLIIEGWHGFISERRLNTFENGQSNDPAYNLWMSQNEPDKDQLKTMRIESQSWPYRPKVSVIVPVYNPNEYDLTECIKSVLVQIYDNWELCLVDGGSETSYVKRIIRKFANRDRRIKFISLPQNLGIAGNSNEALKLATGEYIGFLDHDDMLAPFALYEVVKLLNQDRTVDFIYSDEDKVPENGKNRFQPFFKPGWSPDTFLSYNYLCHFSVIRRTLIEQVGGFRKGYDGAQDYDLMLRAVQKTDNIRHIPKILYHWRATSDSAASQLMAKPYALDAAKRAIGEYLKGHGYEAEVSDGLFPTSYRVKYKLRSSHYVSIIIPTRDMVHLLSRCVSSILEKTEYKNYEILIVDNQSKEKETHDFFNKIQENPKVRVISYDRPFNYAILNNEAVRHAKYEYLLFLNNDTEIINGEWLSAMLEFAQRDDVGAVGAKLYYPDGTIQHGGVIIGLSGLADHSHRYMPGSSPGDMGRLKVIQNLSAVTAACMMVRKKVFEEVKGFDERLSHDFNDVDLCLKIRQRGYLIIFTPYAELYHHELGSRGQEERHKRHARSLKDGEYVRNKWKQVYEKGDPYYNPNLSLDKPDFSLRI